ncbi:MAG TPA: AAA family ATPase, partial [Clostridia bacterium]|nr:AAA family ATPase [Clostridia bacterium]
VELAKINELEYSNLKIMLTDLIKEDKITLTFASISENPFIKRFQDLTIDKQIENLELLPLNEICIYPSSNILPSIDSTKYNNTPFSKMLFLGDYQLKAIFFDPIVLESYFQDPRYIIVNRDYSGNISISNSFFNSDEVSDKDKIVLQSFGIGYTTKTGAKVIVGLLRYLSHLSPEHQQRWHSHIILEECIVEQDYMRNILGIWNTHISIYTAFIEELYHISEISKLMGREPLFKQTFKDSKPRNFTSLLRPTLKNYNEFVHLLDKMLSDNINKKFFGTEIPLETETVRSDGKILVSNKGTITLLDEWMKTNIEFQDETAYFTILDPIKKVRTGRQKPAHNVQEDVFDKTYYVKQKELIISVYLSLRTIRLLFMNHPSARNYEVPDWLDVKKIKVY